MSRKNIKNRSGFTLIELLVVIAIIAILAIVVVLTLNPAQLIQQARDSNRISDLSTIKSAVAFYLEDVQTPTLGNYLTCYNDGPLLGTTVVTTTCPWFSGITTLASSTNRSTGGSGWIPVNLNAISVGAPIGQWPVDPLNTVASSSFVDATSHFYSYTASTTVGTFKIEANMESTKYASSGTADVESTDGGTYPQVYEQGSNLSL